MLRSDLASSLGDEQSVCCGTVLGMEGPGKYDAACEQAFYATRDDGSSSHQTTVLIVAGGKLGQGFSVVSTDPGIRGRLPGWLRMVAAQIEADDLKNGGN